MNSIAKNIKQEEEKRALSSLGKELQLVQEEMVSQRIRNSANNIIEQGLAEGQSFESIMTQINGIPDRSDLNVIRHLYENAPKYDLQTRRDLLVIAKQIAYNENKYHYNEIYAIAAYLAENGIPAEDLFISGHPESGVYQLTDTKIKEMTYVIIKNHDTKWAFGKNGPYDKDEYASFIHYQGAVFAN